MGFQGPSVARSTRQEIENRVIERASCDDAFRQQLLKNPKWALREATGIELPASVSVKVVEEDANTLYLVLPARLGAEGELSDLELEAVAGGKPAPRPQGSINENEQGQLEAVDEELTKQSSGGS